MDSGLDAGSPPAVVVGVDGTTYSAGALRYAAWQAAQSGAPLLVVHVVTGYLPVPELPTLSAQVEVVAEQVLQHAEGEALKVAPEIDVSTCIQRGAARRAWSTWRRGPASSSSAARPRLLSNGC